MPKYSALLVEDDPEQAKFSEDLLKGAGFETVHVWSASEALKTVEGAENRFELIVLDRRLPAEFGESASDLIGDQLLDDLLTRIPDSAFVVFTGHTDVHHTQFTMMNRGSISCGPSGEAIDRVVNFEKSQSVEFESHIRSIASSLSRFDDIELKINEVEQVSAASRRLLRRVAAHFGGESIAVRPLAGGLTNSPVWHCQITGNKVLLADVVVKQSECATPSGGFQARLPAYAVAAPVAEVTGLCRGLRATVLQTAGTDPVSLLGLMGSDPEAASKAAQSVIDLISSGIHQPQEMQRLTEICRAFEKWDSISERLSAHGITVPPGTRFAGTSLTACHGDLHPGNVLLVQGVPVFIDFDSQIRCSRLVDLIALSLGGIFHKDSPIKHEIDSAVDLSKFGTPEFSTNGKLGAYFRILNQAIIANRVSDREFWTLTLAYAARQLKYSDILDDSQQKKRALTLARVMAMHLDAS